MTAWLELPKKESEKVRAQQEVPIRVMYDFREHDSGVPEALYNKGIDIQKLNMNVADYVVSDRVAIERKANTEQGSDFVSSIFDQRLFDQAYRMREAYELPLIIVEGTIFYGNISENAVRGAILSLALDFGIQVLFSRNVTETAEYIFAAARREQTESKRSIIVKSKPKAMTMSQKQLRVMSSFPLISGELADRILRQFGTLRKVFALSEKDFLEHPPHGLGEKRSKKIFEIIDAEYQ